MADADRTEWNSREHSPKWTVFEFYCANPYDRRGRIFGCSESLWLQMSSLKYACNSRGMSPE